MLSPLVLGVGAAGLVVLGAIGAIVTGSGLGLVSTAPRAGVLPSRRDSVRAHTGIDGLLVAAQDSLLPTEAARQLAGRFS